MNNFTIDDIKLFQKVFEHVSGRGDELIKLNSFLNPQTFGDYYSNGIYEVLEDQVGFDCEHNHYYDKRIVYLTFEQLLSNEYYEQLKIDTSLKEANDKREKEQKLIEEAQEKEKAERELYESLKVKFEGQ